MIYAVLIWRLYGIVTLGFILNAFSRLFFKYSNVHMKDVLWGFIQSIPFILIWPVAFFSEGGTLLNIPESFLGSSK